MSAFGHAMLCYAVQIFLDVTERLDATIDGRSSMLQRAEVFGEVACRCALSGMPQLTLSFVTAETRPPLHNPY